MAVNWNWKCKKGIITWFDEYSKKNYKVNIYQGNCLGALIYDYKDEETKKNMYQFMGFWNDETHLKRCLGLVKGHDNLYKNIIVKIKLNTYYKDCLKIAQLFAKANIKVELYYKEIK